MTKEEKEYLIATLEYGLNDCSDDNGNTDIHFNSFANSLEIVKNCAIPDVVVPKGTLVCEDCGSEKEVRRISICRCYTGN